MPAEEYRLALDAALRELEQAMADRAALDTRIAQLHETVGTLTRLCGFTPTVPYGLTDACRAALRCADTPMTAVDVRARLEATGFDLTKYANALAAIHTVLKRLTESGEAIADDADEARRRAYRAVTASTRRPGARAAPKRARRR